jgi:OOP family OmpA-OmpF porin
MLHHYYHLIETEPQIEIGDVCVSDDGTSYTVDKSMRFAGVMMLFSRDGKPVFEPNANILSRRIIEGAKDSKFICFHLLRYFRYLRANHLQWDESNHQLQRYSFFLYCGYLNAQIESGNMSRTKAAAALSIIRRFYLFCYRHGDIAELPFNVTGVTKFEKNLTGYSLQNQTKETRQLLNDLDSQHVGDNCYCNGFIRKISVDGQCRYHYRKLMKKIIVLTSLLSFPVLAATESPQVFVGVKGGYQWALDDNYHHSNPKGSILGLYSGLQFTPSWSLDLGYQYHDKVDATATSVSVKTWLIESALRYDWYLQDKLSLYGRLGAAYWHMEKTQLSSNKSDATGFSPLGEVGINYTFNPNVRLSTGYQYIDSIGNSNTGKYDSRGLLVSLTYTFGSSTQPALETAPTPIIEDTLVKETGTVTASAQIQSFSPKTTELLFGFDSVEPSQEFIDQLTEVASVLNSYPQAQAVVVGHTDSIGSAHYNQKLSERRAQVVVNKLIELKVTPIQLEWQGDGESRPIADNNTAEGRAKNCRVEITILSFQSQE